MAERKLKTIVQDYLKERGAIGKDNAIKAEIIARDLNISKRALTEQVGVERGNGACICSSTYGKCGYFLPRDRSEIERQFKTLENGFRQRARSIRPFREYMKAHRKQ